jgi:hypothetical protein
MTIGAVCLYRRWVAKENNEKKTEMAMETSFTKENILTSAAAGRGYVAATTKAPITTTTTTNDPIISFRRNDSNDKPILPKLQSPPSFSAINNPTANDFYAVNPMNRPTTKSFSPSPSLLPPILPSSRDFSRQHSFSDSTINTTYSNPMLMPRLTPSTSSATVLAPKSFMQTSPVAGNPFTVVSPIFPMSRMSIAAMLPQHDTNNFQDSGINNSASNVNFTPRFARSSSSYLTVEPEMSPPSPSSTMTTTKSSRFLRQG